MMIFFMVTFTMANVSALLRPLCGLIDFPLGDSAKLIQHNCRRFFAGALNCSCQLFPNCQKTCRLPRLVDVVGRFAAGVNGMFLRQALRLISGSCREAVVTGRSETAAL